MEPKLSIIIIVKNDRGISDTLAALELQKKPVPTEIIVVDASDPSYLADIREKFKDVRWFQFSPKIANKTSIPEQRNFGILHTKSDVIVFIDANCVPSENWLVNLTKPILDGKETMTAGSVRAADPKRQVNFNPIHVKNNYLTSSPTINLAFKKNIWTAVGGFDESFLFGSDIDFTWRCCDIGNKIRFVPEAYITHDWGNFEYEIKRIFKYGKARAHLFIKHPHRYKELFSESIIVPIYTLYIIGLPFTIVFPWYPLIIILAMLRNIRNKPFKTVFLNLIYTIGFLKQIIVWCF